LVTQPAIAPRLGFYRLVLALLVVLQHAATSILPPSLSQAISPLELGGLAVLLFFIVSGFIITQVAHTTYQDRPRAFLTNRLLRLIPSYWAALLLTTSVTATFALTGTTGPIATELSQTPNQPVINLAANALAILPGAPILMRALNVEPILELVWALRIELLFYAVIWLALITRQRLTSSIDRILAIPAIATLIIYLPLMERWRGGSFEYAPYFLFGCAVYFVCATPHNRAWPMAFALAAGVAIALHQLGRPPVHEAGFERHLMAQYLVLAAAIGLWLALLFQKPAERSQANRDQLAGEYSYPLYLAHVVAMVLTEALIPTPSWAATAIALALSFSLAAVLVGWVERPIANLRSHIRRSPTPQT
jgi:peptidoglycan/LPS O-acetylase OafA/YrhL